LKTCILFARIVELQDGQSLADQLRRKWQCGFEIQSWSNLPQGSGLGTSSILAAGIIAALWSATDMNFNRESVVHAVSNRNLLGTYRNLLGTHGEPIGDPWGTHWKPIGNPLGTYWEPAWTHRNLLGTDWGPTRNPLGTCWELALA
jgi:hypothetical protein